MPSRKDDLRETASLAGNSAAHVAVYPDSNYTILEAILYAEQAAKIAQMRTWNDREIAFFRDRTIRNAGNEIKQRRDAWGERSYHTLLTIATAHIDDFITNELRKKKARSGKQ